MKLERFKGFVRKLNEEREAPEYDSLTDFRREMGKDVDETDLDEFDSPEEDEFGGEDEYAMDRQVVDDEDHEDEEDDTQEELNLPNWDDDGDDEDDEDDSMSWSADEDEMVRPSADRNVARSEMGDFSDDTDGFEEEDDYQQDEMFSTHPSKLQDLAKKLSQDEPEVKVKDNQIQYNGKVINHYSETNNLHIGKKEFKTAQAAYDFLKSGDSSEIRDTSESKSYRFKRRK